MTIQREFYDYQARPPGHAIGGRCSPNLLMLMTELERKWGCTSLGCFGVRNVRLGERPSTHSYGAAIDVGVSGMVRPVVVEQLLPYLVAWSHEWGVQAIHDYVGSRIWRAGRTPNVGDACTTWWKAQKRDSAGMGHDWAQWLHVEVTPAAWPAPWSAAERGLT